MSSGRKIIRRRLRTALLKPLLTIAKGLIARCRYESLPRWAGRLNFLLAGKRSGKRIVETNLRIAFPEWSIAEIRALRKKNFQQITQTALEFLWFMRYPQQLRELVDMSDPQVQQAMALAKSGKSMILMSPHLGNWELAGQAMAVNEVPLSAVASPLMNSDFDRQLTAVRQAQGIEIIPETGAVRGMLKSLRNGRTVGVLIDQNVRLKDGGIFVDFFGVPAATTRAVASLARKTGAECVCIACIRENGRLRIVAQPLPKPTSEYTADAELVQDQILANEALIRKYPEQYLWTYQRWRYIPPDAAVQTADRFPFYAKNLNEA